ncbi:dTDP-4-dehydrorhamnose 3,5-epimerase [Okeania sp.]|uniref:dTDP-4-dehydrorhamnose 3,5-epimerase n=1 Tax=Okeania sp. TaxID=3100323 RepID=UPI002B4B8373|nr:dTDP-4-dehydrorhamnose 3,5-epimerase [Okeania sp.]MEB3343625.1 dTDP-4-dehydrorhamnose 3,5-epimerase [Okeania sp.]
MVKIPSIEILQLNSKTVPEGISYYTSLNCSETMVATYPPKTRENLYVHRNQTDYIQVVRGKFIWIILSKGKYQYIPLSEKDSFVVKVPPKIPHGAINPYDETCVMVNAIVRHKPLTPKEYRPIIPPSPYDIEKALSSEIPIEKICSLNL